MKKYLFILLIFIPNIIFGQLAAENITIPDSLRLLDWNSGATIFKLDTTDGITFPDGSTMESGGFYLGPTLPTNKNILNLNRLLRPTKLNIETADLISELTEDSLKLIDKTGLFPNKAILTRSNFSFQQFSSNVMYLNPHALSTETNYIFNHITSKSTGSVMDISSQRFRFFQDSLYGPNAKAIFDEAELNKLNLNGTQLDTVIELEDIPFIGGLDSAYVADSVPNFIKKYSKDGLKYDTVNADNFGGSAYPDLTENTSVDGSSIYNFGFTNLGTYSKTSGSHNDTSIFLWRTTGGSEMTFNDIVGGSFKVDIGGAIDFRMGTNGASVNNGTTKSFMDEDIMGIDVSGNRRVTLQPLAAIDETNYVLQPNAAKTTGSVMKVNNSSAGTVLRIDEDSVEVVEKFSSKYYIGQLYTDDGLLTVSIGTIDTYETITGFETVSTWNISENLTLTDSTITIPADGSGYYDVYIGNSYTHSVNNTVCHVSLFVQRGGLGADIEVTVNEAERKIGTGGDVGDAGRECILWLGGGDVLKARVKADNTGTITINHGTFKAVRIN